MKNHNLQDEANRILNTFKVKQHNNRHKYMKYFNNKANENDFDADI